MKEIKNAYLREAGACFPHDVFLLPAEDESKVIMRGDLSSARIWDIEHGIHYHVWKILLGERTPRNLISESYHCLPAKCACQRNWPTNKMGSHFSAGRSENCLKVLGGDLTIWSAISASNQFWQTQAHSCQSRGLLRNEPILLVCCKGWGMCCQASIWQRFGVRVGRRKRIKYCGEMKRPVYGL